MIGPVQHIGVELAHRAGEGFPVDVVRQVVALPDLSASGGDHESGLLQILQGVPQGVSVQSCRLSDLAGTRSWGVREEAHHGQARPGRQGALRGRSAFRKVRRLNYARHPPIQAPRLTQTPHR